MLKDFEEKVNCPPLPFCLLILLSSHQVTQTREEEEEEDNNAPLYLLEKRQKQNRMDATCVKNRPRVSSFFCVCWSLFLSNLILVHTFRSPFDVDAFFFFFSAYKQHYQQQNGPIRERLRIGTRPKLRQRRDWETDIESARAAGRDADVYFRER